MGRRGRASLVVPFILPALVVYTVIFVYPAIQAFWVSLHNWSGFGNNMVYVGLDNYREMLKDRVFLQAMKKTLLISFGGGIGIFSVALFFAAALQRNLWGKKFFRAVIFFPMVVPGIGVGLIWQFVYNKNWGPLSGLLQGIGLGALDQTWLGPDLIMKSLTTAIVWTYVGYYMVILLAGIDKIPITYYEAAILDGASEWKMFFTITLPMIWDVFVIALVLWMINSLKIFDLIAATIFPAPNQSAYTMTIYIWTQSVGMYTPIYRLGYATAMGVVLLLMVVVVVGIIRTVLHRDAIEY